MKLLLTFMLGTFFVAVWTTRRGGRSRVLPLLGISLVVGAAYLTRRAIF
jgi:hypothetical protein